MVNMFYNSFFAILLFFNIPIAESAKNDYDYISEVEGYLKLHRVPAKWEDAVFKCHVEGGVLASPENKKMISAMKYIMWTNRLAGNVFVGVHSKYSKGDFTTIAGTPLSEFDVEWQQGQPDNFQNNEDCLVMAGMGELADVSCDAYYPYICHKSTVIDHICSESDNRSSDYKYENRTGSCYKFHKEGAVWSRAFETCLAEGAYLAIINTKEEVQVIRDLFDYKTEMYASIGFTSLKGEWTTIHGKTLTETGYSFFDEKWNSRHEISFCGSVTREGFLNKHVCAVAQAFICEKVADKLS